ncbi:DUF2541 family protein [Photobacterium leiognathi]|uniref:DUF2541 family protein n=1 Tax=Photobacterium leiognathi TaxID=553611 RepID=UPI000D15FF6D|nr:DUF2541 family protein [Photobacterium leiognathi]PSW58232.1 DUF2541 domain-containing protein [Photobacterium leiognathi subsp. mandapamensis]
MKLKATMAAAMILSAMAFSTTASADTFTLGRTILLEAKNSHAKIPVPLCRNAKSIQIKAERDVFLSKVIFKFQNGSSRVFQFQRKLDKNERTDWRRFSYERCVTDIQVHGRAEDGSAGIRVYGRK